MIYDQKDDKININVLDIVDIEPSNETQKAKQMRMFKQELNGICGVEDGGATKFSIELSCYANKEIPKSSSDEVANAVDEFTNAFTSKIKDTVKQLKSKK